MVLSRSESRLWHFRGAQGDYAPCGSRCPDAKNGMNSVLLAQDPKGPAYFTSQLTASKGFEQQVGALFGESVLAELSPPGTQ
jgi:hypothetical protein